LFFKKTHGIIYSLPENCRIKYLDRQDIEECGWKFSSLAQNFSIITEEDEKNNKLGIWLEIMSNGRIKIIDCRIPIHEVVFNGYIKNKSELQKLMKQLNIQTNNR
jgi:NDP-sugar pyrophosphorylase family protein